MQDKQDQKLIKFIRVAQVIALRAGIFTLLFIIWISFSRHNYNDYLPSKLLYLTLIVMGLNLFFLILANSIVYGYRKRRHLGVGHSDNFTLGIHKVLAVVFWIGSIFVLIDVLFINVFELLTSLTIVAAFIGIVFKDYIINFVNGITIMFTGKFRLGEFVKIGDNKGKIINLTFMHTELLNDTKDIVYVPNNTIFSKEVVNYSRNPVKNIIMNISLSKDYLSDYKKLHASIISSALRDYPETVENEDKISISVETVDKDSITWSVEFITKQYNFILEKNLRNLVAEEVALFVSLMEKKKKK